MELQLRRKHLKVAGVLRHIVDTIIKPDDKNLALKGIFSLYAAAIIFTTTMHQPIISVYQYQMQCY